MLMGIAPRKYSGNMGGVIRMPGRSTVPLRVPLGASLVTHCSPSSRSIERIDPGVQ